MRTGQGRPCENRFHQSMAQAGERAVWRQKGLMTLGRQTGHTGPRLCMCPAGRGAGTSRDQQGSGEPSVGPHSSPAWAALWISCPSLQNSCLVKTRQTRRQSLGQPNMGLFENPRSRCILRPAWRGYYRGLHPNMLAVTGSHGMQADGL